MKHLRWILAVVAVLAVPRDALVLRPDGVTLFRDWNEAMDYVRGLDSARAFICGGATIYRLAMGMADTLELTRLEGIGRAVEHVGLRADDEGERAGAGAAGVDARVDPDVGATGLGIAGDQTD